MHSTELKQQIAQCDEVIAQCLKDLAQAPEDGSAADDIEQWLERLNQTIAEREPLLQAALATELGQDEAWLRQQQQHINELKRQATTQLMTQQNRLGGYRKGRRQVKQYQQIEAGIA
ncbi:hypothetical protein [Ferrimonas marina]|uniref:Flagellar protein FliT n=1 Tax=Ferrimonas marina TaxID=299255 RepID=A0A1M5YF69_9GAMM|nr:hypothetical protein [Ferrimonas marina]SHI10539.1 hypothetical protein SAMN02745129_4166 [Ferrimonas marina]